jgi:hypothetical protein
VVAAAVLAGCHSYTPVRIASVPVGAEVRAHLTDAGREHLQFVPRRRERQVEGTLRRVEEENLILEVRLPRNPNLSTLNPLGQLVTLAPDDFSGLELKQPAHGRTVIAVTGAVTVFATVAVMMLSGRTGGEEGEEPSPPEIRVPLLHWRF